MKTKNIFVLITLLFSATISASEKAVTDVLQRFHLAASQANAEEYFSLLHQDLVFMGTDASERWSKSQLQAFAEPYFSNGKGWTYVATSRNISLSEAGDIAWFDEALENASYGSCRGTGVLVLTEAGWLITQYNLTIPIPNQIAKQVVKQIQAAGSEP